MLLINNDYQPTKLGFKFADVPGLQCGGGGSDNLTAGARIELSQRETRFASCRLFSVWDKKMLGIISGDGFTTQSPVPPRGSFFVTLSDGM